MRGIAALGALIGLALLQLVAALTVELEAPTLRTVRTVTSERPAVPAGLSYRNCDAARTAGAAPVYAGEPGYGAHLDRDRDGVACEPYSH
jgi:Excalibur calcium-binding domain